MQDKKDVLQKIIAEVAYDVEGSGFEHCSSAMEYATFWMGRNQSLISSLFSPAAQPTENEAVKILTELCGLKHHKDTVGKDEFYEKRQPELWEQAKQYLTRLRIKDTSKLPNQDAIRGLQGEDVLLQTPGMSKPISVKLPPANEPVIEPTGNWDELERRVKAEIPALEKYIEENPAYSNTCRAVLANFKKVIAWIGELRGHTTVEPTPEIKAWISQYAHDKWQVSSDTNVQSNSTTISCRFAAIEGMEALYAHLQKESQAKDARIKELETALWKCLDHLPMPNSLPNTKTEIGDAVHNAYKVLNADQQTESKEPAPTPIYDMKVISEAMSRPAVPTEDWEEAFTAFAIRTLEEEGRNINENLYVAQQFVNWIKSHAR